MGEFQEGARFVQSDTPAKVVKPSIDAGAVLKRHRYGHSEQIHACASKLQSLCADMLRLIDLLPQ
jgi:hypothetical protein